MMQPYGKENPFNRRNFLKILFAAGLGAALIPWDLHAQQSASTAAKKPNIVFFYVDDLGWADVGYNGATYHLTPNIDALSKKAMVFDNAYTMPTCAPSRVSLFTGMAAPRTGVYHVEAFAQTPKEYFKVNPVKSQLHFDRPGFAMLGDTMKAGEYVTGYVGKWHVNRDPMKHGFDANTGGCESGCPRSFFSPYGIPALKDGPEGEYLPERMLDASKTFIKNNKEKPFFLFYAPYLVHRPLQARKEDIAKFESRKKEAARSNPTYAAMVEWTDRAFGDILDTLKNENLADNTIMIFSSDNGINGLSGDATPLRGEKGSCYEGGVRVPTMVHWPGVTKAMHNSALIDVLDWYPTLREIAGAPPPKHPLDGVSIVPLLKCQSNSVRDAVYWHMPCYNGKPGHKQIWQTPFSAIRSGKYKLIHFYEDGHVELYDSAKDIGETHNLTKTLPEKSRELKEELSKWVTETKAPLPTRKQTTQEVAGLLSTTHKAGGRFSEECHQALQHCLSRLPPRQMALVEKSRREGTLKSTAVAAGRSVNALYKSLRRIRAILHDCTLRVAPAGGCNNPFDSAVFWRGSPGGSVVEANAANHRQRSRIAQAEGTDNDSSIQSADAAAVLADGRSGSPLRRDRPGRQPAAVGRQLLEGRDRLGRPGLGLAALAAARGGFDLDELQLPDPPVADQPAAVDTLSPEVQWPFIDAAWVCAAFAPKTGSAAIS